MSTSEVSEMPPSSEGAWHWQAKAIGLLSASAGFLLLLVDDLIPRHQQGIPLFSEVSEILEFLFLCPGVGFLALLATQYVYQRELGLKRRIERLEAKRFVALGRIAGSIAHEVRNPLQNIRLLHEELQNQGHEDQKELLKHLGDNAERINMAVKLIYELAKPIYQMEDDFVNNIALQELIEQSIKNVEEDCAASIEVEGVDDSMQVGGQLAGLTLALENVLRNAVQHSQKNTLAEKIQVSVVTERRSYVIRVSNHGQLPKELLSGGAETFTNKDSGLGLGLFITRHMLERMQGSMKIEQQGESVCVSFTLQKGLYYNVSDAKNQDRKKDEKKDEA